MNNKPILSIIVPVYNVEKYLARCLDSILAQTFTDFELIAVDDGSPDNCGNILDKYALKDERVKVIHKENGGLSSARNAGIDVAIGEYICFVDSDDYVSNVFVDRLYTLIKENDADISQCCFKQTSNDTEVSSNGLEIDTYTNVEMIKNLYNQSYVTSVVAWNKMYKKKIFADVRFPHGKIHEDEGTTYKLFYNAAKVVTTTEDLYFYYMADNSITRSGFSLKKLDYLDVLKERMEFYKANNLEQFYKLDVLRFITSSCIFSGQVDEKGIKKELKRECRKKYYKEVLFEEYTLKQKIKCFLYMIHPIFMDIIHKNYIRRKKLV